MQCRLHYNSRLFKLPGFKNYSATTLGHHIFVKGDSISPRLLKHEMAHVAQIERLGLVKFYSLYLFYYLRGLLKLRNHQAAYLAIPFEIDARLAETA